LVGTRVKILALTIIAACVVLPSLVHAFGYNPGVKAGDWIKYGQITFTWTGNGTEPSYLADERNLEWVRLEVIGVSGTIVTVNATVHYINGTETFQSSNDDVNGTTYSGTNYLIAVNLNSGDAISNQIGSPTINQTVGRAYAGAGRDVNLVNLTTVRENQNIVMTTYYDQNTGVLVEMYMKTPDLENMGTIEISMVATETNMWAPIGYSYIAAFSGVCAVLSVAFYYGLRRFNRPKTAQQTST